MAIKLGINGFGRIGRNVLRAIMERPAGDLQVIAINDPAPLDTIAHLFAFDSVHGRFYGPVTIGDGTIDLGRGPIRVSAIPEPNQLAWADVDIALECTGHFLTKALASRHLNNGSSRVLLSAPAKGDIKTVVYGVNDRLVTAKDRIISNASCTTNCLVPVADALDRAFGIRRGHMTTVHCYASTQPVHDRAHDDLYRARAAGLSMIPTSTGAAATLDIVLPHLAGRITGTAIRVPTPNVSCVDLVVEIEEHTTTAEVNAAMRNAASAMPGVMAVSDRKLVSADFNHDPHSAIFASDQTSVQQGNLLRVLAWYDNEWGFSNRMVDMAGLMGRM